MSELDFAALYAEERRKAREKRAASKTPSATILKELSTPNGDETSRASAQEMRDRGVSAMRARDRPSPTPLAGAPRVIAYASEFISEEEEASLVAAAELGADWVSVRGRRLRRLGFAGARRDLEAEFEARVEPRSELPLDL